MSAKIEAVKRKSGQKEPSGGLARNEAKAKRPRGSNRPAPGGKSNRPLPYPYEFKRRVVQLLLEEGMTALVIHREMGISSESVYKSRQGQEDS